VFIPYELVDIKNRVIELQDKVQTLESMIVSLKETLDSVYKKESYKYAENVRPLKTDTTFPIY
jgi:hypothetical protein